jgi:hypothetical protein
MNTLAHMYDTLMQMGRWFGYRPGYIDLCRLYTTDDLVEWFEHIADASEELREEFDFMAASGATRPEIRSFGRPMHRLQHATTNRGARFTRQVAPFQARRRRRTSAPKLGSTSRCGPRHASRISAIQVDFAARTASRRLPDSRDGESSNRRYPTESESRTVCPSGYLYFETVNVPVICFLSYSASPVASRFTPCVNLFLPHHHRRCK